jgi:Ser/Thr protein kinase RdoA (MazF antagonist)
VIELLEPLVGAPVVLEDLKHKPGRRRTMRASGPAGSAIVKVYASERAPVVASRVAALASGPCEPELPRVLLVDPARRLVVLTDVRGAPFREAVLAGDAAACAGVGRALGVWHGFWQGRAPRALRPHTVGRELEILEARADAAPSAVRIAVRAAARSLADEWPCSTVVHRDLYEDQILVGDRAALIDLDDAAVGPPELDVGNLLAHLELLEARSGRALAPMLDAVLAGYARSGGPLDDELLARCRRLALLRLACIHDDAAFALTASSQA